MSVLRLSLQVLAGQIWAGAFALATSFQSSTPVGRHANLVLRQRSSAADGYDGFGHRRSAFISGILQCSIGWRRVQTTPSWVQCSFCSFPDWHGCHGQKPRPFNQSPHTGAAARFANMPLKHLMKIRRESTQTEDSGNQPGCQRVKRCDWGLSFVL